MPKNLFDEFNIEYEKTPSSQQQAGPRNLLAQQDVNLEQNINPEQSRLQKLGNIAGKANRFIEGIGLPAAAGGLLQGVGNTGISIANLIPGINIPHLNMRDKLPSGIVNSLAFGGGDIAGQLAGFLGAGGAVGKIGQALNLARPAGKAGIVADLARNAGIGYAVGENEEGGGRALSALLAGAGGAASEWMSNKKVANRIVADKVAENKIGSELYNKVFETAKKQGIKSVPKAPKIDLKAIKKGAPGKFTNYLDELKSSPTISNMHKAQSDLGKWMRNVEQAVTSGTAPASTINAYNKAGQAQKKILDSMYKTLGKDTISPALAESYAAATANWRGNVVPYNRLKSVADFERGDLSAANMLKKLGKNDKFTLPLGEKYPELVLGDFLNKGLKKAGSTAAKIGTGGAAVGAGVAGIPRLKDIFGID